MNVGRIVEERSGEKVDRYCEIHLPFMVRERFFILPTPQDRAKEGSPDFEVYGYCGRIGGIWNRTSESGNAYKSMSVQGADRTYYFAIFELDERKHLKEGVVATHNVVYNAPKKEGKALSRPAVEVVYESDEEIPF